MAKEFFALKHSSNVGRQCMHCGRPATWTALRKIFGMKSLVRYCQVHKEMIVDEGLTSEPESLSI